MQCGLQAKQAQAKQALAVPRGPACRALPTAKQASLGACTAIAARPTRSPQARRAGSQRVQAIVAEPPEATTIETFPRGSHWQVRGRGLCRRHATAAATAAAKSILSVPLVHAYIK